MIPILAAVILTVLATLVILNLRAEKKIDVKPATHLRGVGSAVPALDGRAARARRSSPATASKRCSTATRSFPSMLAAIRGASRRSTSRRYIYWSGDDREGVRRSARRARARRRQGPRAARLGRQPEDGQRLDRRDAQAGVEIEQIPPAALVQPRPPQQPHAPQAPGRRRPRRLHRRRRHRRQVERPRAGPGALARHALSARRARRWRRCRRHSWTTGPR